MKLRRVMEFLKRAEEPPFSKLTVRASGCVQSCRPWKSPNYPKKPGPGAHVTILFVLIGLPGCGKTTRARELEQDYHAIRLTPDEWMIPLFNESEADGKRDILEGRFVAVARQALRAGTNTVLDFGVWSKEERSALRTVAAQAGAECRLVYLPIDRAEQRRRLDKRAIEEPNTTFEISNADLDSFDGYFVEPQSEELTGSTIDPPPAGFATWEAWTADRWPTSMM